MPRKRIGDALREKRRISSEDLESALQEHENSAQLFGELLLSRGLVSKEDVIAALEEVGRFRYVDARAAAVEKSVLLLVPRSVAEHYCVLPVAREGRKIVVIMPEPQNLRVLDELRFLAGADIVPRLGFRAEIAEAIARCYGELEPAPPPPDVPDLPFLEQIDIGEIQFFTASASERNKAAMEEFEAELRNDRTPAVRLVSAVVAAAAARRASDIHIEPHALGTTVRIRIDGVLRELTHIPAEFTTSLISRIKILSDIDIAERRVPQDGRFLVKVAGRSLDMRVSTLPTHYGEKVAIRILDPAASRVEFTELGLSEANADAISQVLRLPQGMLLVTGPTGSGKSTTLYSALKVLRSPSVHIMTVEDPVEYKIDDVNQVQVNPKQGLTFASCLRSMLRQDPNVIMVGEIRDQETAEIALQAAQTGHLVLSTMHTTDAIAAVTRLMDFNIPGFMIAASVTGVVAQRLVRKLCTCREQVPVNDETTARLLAAGIAGFGGTMYIPVGCPQCDHSGYKGRIGIYEVLVLDEQMRASLRVCQFKDGEIRNLARGAGMNLMQEDALEKIRQGITTIDEVLRVVPFEQAKVAHCPACSRPLAPSFDFCPSCGAAMLPAALGDSRRLPATPPQGVLFNPTQDFSEGAVLNLQFRLVPSGLPGDARAEVRYWVENPRNPMVKMPQARAIPDLRSKRLQS